MRAGLLALVAGLVVCAPAQAGVIEKSLRAAEGYWWGQKPACPVEVVAEPLSHTSRGASGDAELGGCRMWVNRPALNHAYRLMPARWRKVRVCAVVVHEYGHLLGHEHAEHGVMSHDWTIPPTCYIAFRGRVG
jgi:hypothetical protein